MCGVRKKSVVSGMSHRRCKDRECAVPGVSYLQYEKKVVQCEERVYRMRRATFAVGGQGAWCEEKVCIIRYITFAVQEEKCAVHRGSHLQYKQNVVQCEERVCSIRTSTSAVGGEGVWCEEKVCSISIAHLWYKE